jgi:DNA-directed RNA polymerase
MSISRCKSIEKLRKSSLERVDLAMDIVADFDTILWDMYKKQKHLEDNTFTTVTLARVAIKFSVDATLMAQFTRFRLPMIEKPDDWHEGLKGGYYLNKRKITTNKGEGNQPERVCKVLNMLQEQAFYLRHDVDATKEKELLFEKFKSEGYSPVQAMEITKNITVTTSDTYKFLEDRPFYFEWRYDFRGRLYSTGYDVNLQSSKYKKGSIQYRWENNND